MTTETERVAGLCERLEAYPCDYCGEDIDRAAAELRRLAKRVDELQGKLG